jgi:uncharacterized damage-inducible protein DinB
VDDPRIDPPYVLGERDMLTVWLDWERATLAWKCHGLSPQQLAERSVPPSSLSLLGLVQHMIEVERNWFRRVLGGEAIEPIYYTEEERDGDFDNLRMERVDDVRAHWEAECDHSRAAVAAADSLDVTGERRGEKISLRWILVHMIEEYARHNGHADLLRERIDGAVGD